LGKYCDFESQGSAQDLDVYIAVAVGGSDCRHSGGEWAIV
jgi:hypothetical protein